jgi:hypothetical protein
MNAIRDTLEFPDSLLHLLNACASFVIPKLFSANAEGQRIRSDSTTRREHGRKPSHSAALRLFAGKSVIP